MYVSVQVFDVAVAEAELAVVLALTVVMEEETVVDSATQRIWPTWRSQLASKVGFQAYNCASVMLNAVQIR